MTYQWLTTAPNPRSRATGHDAGQRGWKLHAVAAQPTMSLREVRFRPALCGLRARHGWGVDGFIDEKCVRCTAKLKLLDSEPARV